MEMEYYVVVGVALLIGYRYLMGSEPAELARPPQKGKKGPTIPGGLANMGNTCFLNSVLQALASSPRLKQHLATFHDTSSVSYSLLTLIECLNTGSKRGKTFRPTSLLKTLKGSVRELLGYSQQDAHEFYSFLSTILTNEHIYSPPILSLAHLNLMSGAGPIFVKNGKRIRLPAGLVRPTSRNPFTGLLASQIACLDCGFSSPWRHDTFDNISLTVSASSLCTLDSLLNLYTQPEVIHGYVCDKCSLLKTVSSGEQTLMVYRDKMAKLVKRVSLLSLSPPSSSGHSNQNGSQSPSRHSDQKCSQSPSGHPDQNGGPSPSEFSDQNGVSPSGHPNQNDESVESQVKEDTTEQTLRIKRLFEAEIARLELEANLLSTCLSSLQCYKTLQNYDDIPYTQRLPKIRIESSHVTKRIQIAYAPASLCLHMQRSVVSPSGYIVKNNARVIFNETMDLNKLVGISSPSLLDQLPSFDSMPPLEEVPNLEEAPSIDSVPPKVFKTLEKPIQPVSKSRTKGPFLYNLSAVILHFGTHSSGHFITLRKVKQTSKKHAWYRISDDRVDLIHSIEEEVLNYGSRYVFMLFYDRI